MRVRYQEWYKSTGRAGRPLFWFNQAGKPKDQPRIEKKIPVFSVFQQNSLGFYQILRGVCGPKDEELLCNRETVFFRETWNFVHNAVEERMGTDGKLTLGVCLLEAQ